MNIWVFEVKRRLMEPLVGMGGSVMVPVVAGLETVYFAARDTTQVAEAAIDPEGLSNNRRWRVDSVVRLHPVAVL